MTHDGKMWRAIHADCPSTAKCCTDIEVDFPVDALPFLVETADALGLTVDEIMWEVVYRLTAPWERA